MTKALLISIGAMLIGVLAAVGVLPAVAAPLALPHHAPQTETGEVSGIVFLDRNGNGFRDAGERGVASVHIELRDAATGGQSYLAMTTTLADGTYSFAGLAPADYVVIETDPEAYISTTPNTLTVTVNNKAIQGLDFGNALPATVSGAVYDDSNEDGFQGPTEQPIADALVEVFEDANGNGQADPGEPVLGSAISDVQGNYIVTGLRPGPRVVRIQPPGVASETIQIGIPLESDEVSGGSVWLAAPIGRRSQQPAAIADRILVRFTDAASPEWIAQLLAEHALQVTGRIPGIEVYILETRPGRAEGTLAALVHLPEVRYAERDYVVRGSLTPSDPLYSDPNSVYAPQLINAETAWNITTGAPTITVAILDTGVSLSHPEFAGRLLAGYDFVNSDSDPSDDHGHGTHVAGILGAAMNNAQGSTGIAPGVKILPVKVLNALNNGSWSAVANGLIYAADQGVKIINMSLGGTTSSSTLYDAVQYAVARGCLMIVAAGNGGSSTPYYPAYYSETFAVSATNNYDQLWSLSSYGGWIDISAPGFAIYSTYWTASNPTGYAFQSGTSMAAPHVSGVAALILSIRPSLSAADLRGLIQGNVVDLGDPGPDQYFGAGRINAGGAVIAAQSWTPYTPTPTPGPTASPSPTATASPTATRTPTSPPTSTPTATPTGTALPTATRTPTATATPTATQSATPTQTAAATATPTTPPYVQRVNAAGSAYTDTLGQVWQADQAYTAGSWGYASGTAKSSTTAVAGTNDDLLYQKYREGMSKYDFTVPNAAYQVTLKFAEFAASSSSTRVMKITIEGTEVESALNVYALVGKAVAFDRTYTTNVTDGLLTIAFAQNGGKYKPMVSAIEVKTALPPSTATPTATRTPTITPGGPTFTPTFTPTSTATPTATPTTPPYSQRVNAGGTTYTDGQGQVWAADKAYAAGSWGYTGGSVKSSTTAVAGTNDDLLYQKYREGMSKYDFTVPNGAYQVGLKFAEFATTSVGDRKMQIAIEGVVVESALDVYALVGTAVALDRSYTTNVTDGLLTITFAKNGGRKSPMVSAIEVR